MADKGAVVTYIGGLGISANSLAAKAAQAVDDPVAFYQALETGLSVSDKIGIGGLVLLGLRFVFDLWRYIREGK